VKSLAWRQLGRKVETLHKAKCPSQQIAMHTGSHKDLDNHSVAECLRPLRYIITVQKLKK